MSVRTGIPTMELEQHHPRWLSCSNMCGQTCFFCHTLFPQKKVETLFGLVRVGWGTRLGSFQGGMGKDRAEGSGFPVHMDVFGAFLVNDSCSCFIFTSVSNRLCSKSLFSSMLGIRVRKRKCADTPLRRSLCLRRCAVTPIALSTPIRRYADESNPKPSLNET